MFCMTRAARAPEIACDSRKQTLYRLNPTLGRIAKAANVGVQVRTTTAHGKAEEFKGGRRV